MPGESPKSGGAGKFVLVAALLVAVAVVGFFGFKSYQGSLFMSRLNRALAANQIFSPPGNCAADIYWAENAKNPSHPKLKEAAAKLKAKVLPTGEAAFDRWYKDSDQTVDWGETERIYNFIVAIFPGDADLQAKMAYCQGQQAIARKDWPGSIQAFQAALRSKPNWALPLNGLGKVYIQRGSPYFNEAQAIAFYKEAARVDGQFTWALKNLGEYYRREKDWPSAYTYMKKALETNPEKPSIMRSLGDICYSSGRYDEAYNYLNQSMQYETDPAVNEKIRIAIGKVQAKRGY